MEDRQRTLAAATIVIGLVVFAIVLVGVFITGKKIVSPIPDEGAIKIIFISPTIQPLSLPSATQTPTTTPKPVTKKAAPSPTKAPATGSAVLTPTP